MYRGVYRVCIVSVSMCIKAYQSVSWATRYTTIRPDTVPIHADTKSAPLSSISDCEIQRDDSKKRDRVRISDVSTSVSGIVSVIAYLPVSVVCIVLYRTAYHTLYPRSCIALGYFCVSQPYRVVSLARFRKPRIGGGSYRSRVSSGCIFAVSLSYLTCITIRIDHR